MRMDQPRGPDVGTLLIRAIRAQAIAAGGRAHVESIACVPWSSATFTGTQHRLTIAVDAVPDLRSWIAALPEAQFALRGHIVADLVVDEVVTTGGTTRIRLAILTLIDA